MSRVESLRDVPVSEHPFPSPVTGWYTTILLSLLFWLSLLDRSIISLMVDPIKADLGISDVQFGMLHGLAFAITFSVFGLVAGTFADHFSRRVMVFASVTVWSLATAACGMAQNFWHLLIARVGVGAGEAGLNPCATSMITDLFPPDKLTFALAIYALGASVGSGCAFLFGGMLIDLVSQSDVVSLPLIGDVSPWKSVFYIVGIPGVLLGFLAFTIPEPKRRGVRSAQKNLPLSKAVFSGYGELIAFIRQRKRFFILHYTGFGLASLCFVGGAAWYPAHMGRAFGWSATEIGLALGLTLIAAGILGKFLCGICVGFLYRRGHKDAQFIWYSFCLLLACPAGVLATISGSPVVFLAGISLFLLLLSPLTAVYVSSLNMVTPNELRGAGVAFFSATVGLLALSLGPILIAVISDLVFGGNAIGYGMATLIAISAPMAAIALLSGRKPMREAVTDAEQWQ